MHYDKSTKKILAGVNSSLCFPLPFLPELPSSVIMYVLKMNKSIVPFNLCFGQPFIIQLIIQFILSFIISCIMWFIIWFLRQLTSTGLLDQQILYQPDARCQGFLRWLKFVGLFCLDIFLIHDVTQNVGIFSFDVSLLPPALKIPELPQFVNKGPAYISTQLQQWMHCVKEFQN